MKECDNSTRKIHISSNFILSIRLLIMFDTLLLRPSLHCNTPLHFTTLRYLISKTLSRHTCLASCVSVRYSPRVINSDSEPSLSCSADDGHKFLWHKSGSLCVVASSSSPSASLRNVSMSYEKLLLSCNHRNNLLQD